MHPRCPQRMSLKENTMPVETQETCSLTCYCCRGSDSSYSQTTPSGGVPCTCLHPDNGAQTNTLHQTGNFPPEDVKYHTGSLHVCPPWTWTRPQEQDLDSRYGGGGGASDRSPGGCGAGCRRARAGGLRRTGCRCRWATPSHWGACDGGGGTPGVRWTRCGRSPRERPRWCQTVWCTREHVRSFPWAGTGSQEGHTLQQDDRDTRVCG